MRRIGLIAANCVNYAYWKFKSKSDRNKHMITLTREKNEVLLHAIS